MKIFPKTFICILTLLMLIALLANGLIYTLMPTVYTKQKQQNLDARAEQFAKQLGDARQDDIVALMGAFSGSAQANVTIEVGGARYALIIWGDAAGANGTATTYVTVTSDKALINSKSGEVTTKVFTDSPGQGEYLKSQPGIETVIKADIGSPVKTITAQKSFNMEGQPGTLSATMTLAPVGEAVGVIVSLLPISILLCVIIAIAFSFFYARAMTRPIRAISFETRNMTRLERGAKCKIQSKDEFGELAANVNELYENLLKTIDKLEDELKKVSAAELAKTDFLRAASHELKTPVTAASLIMENMILDVGKYKNHKEWLLKCKELMDKLSTMLHDILNTSRLEEASEPCITEGIEKFCSGVIEPYLIIARAKGLSLYIDWSAAFIVTAPPKLLSKALSNIFSNAVQYTVTGGRVAVYCRGRSLIVENECKPVSEDHLPRLVEPFYRPDESRNRDTGGNGLGLYITDTALRLIGLDYCFEPMTDPDGMRFDVNF